MRTSLCTSIYTWENEHKEARLAELHQAINYDAETGIIIALCSRVKTATHWILPTKPELLHSKLELIPGWKQICKPS